MVRPLNARSLTNLVGVHPDLSRVVVRANQLAPWPITVIEGLRTEARQRDLYAQGRTKPGKKVTWTMDSKHRRQGDGTGHAVDVAVIEGSVVHWDRAGEVAKFMLRAADELDVKVRWGGNWDGDDKPGEKGESDGPHFEIVL
jgi:peptidoglycan L-alanyl-D-glutamate endopeptidase CwlK